MLAILLAAALSHAQDAVSVELVSTAQVGHGNPKVILHFNVDGNVAVNLSCGGHKAGGNHAASPGTSWEIPIEGLREGQHRCSGSLTLNAADGTSGEMPLGFDVAMVPALKLTVDPSELDLATRSLVVTGSRNLTKVRVEALGPRGVALGDGETGTTGNRAEIQWGGRDTDEVLKLVVTAWDENNLPGRVELFPWSYAIPHQDVVFASGSHEITVSEAPKLEDAWQELVAVKEKYGDIAQVKLFVAGYTDTMGGHEANQSLSERRARSIATWFRSRGFDDPIAWQGFGETVLAKATPDQTDEPANRRSIYLLAAQTPAIGPELPRRNWTGL